MTEDTYTGSQYDPQSLNRYAYAMNNPVNMWDPTGNVPDWVQACSTHLEWYSSGPYAGEIENAYYFQSYSSTSNGEHYVGKKINDDKTAFYYYERTITEYWYYKVVHCTNYHQDLEDLGGLVTDLIWDWDTSERYTTFSDSHDNTYSILVSAEIIAKESQEEIKKLIEERIGTLPGNSKDRRIWDVDAELNIIGNFRYDSREISLSVVDQRVKEILDNKPNQGTGNDYIIIDETNKDYAGRVLLSSDLRTLGFTLRHPIAASEIGKVIEGKGNTNISTNAVRFSNNELGLKENEEREGSQVNAFRHALWQATITQQFGANIALEIGNAHENNPYGIKGIENFDKVRFTTLLLADEAIDLLNNKIGREIGQKENSSDMKNIAIATLDYYHEKGLWVAVKQDDGFYAINQEKLSVVQYNTAKDRLNILDSNGFAPEDK